MDNLIRDLRHALRSAAQRPGFTVAVVLTLGLGIGASTAIFSLVDAALLRPLPFKDPQGLVFLWGVAGPEKDIRGASYPEFRDWQRLTRTLDPVSIFDNTPLTYRTDTGAERIEAELVSGNYFSLVGASAGRGRTFGPEDDRVLDASPVAVVSHPFWQDRLVGSADVLGKTLHLNGRAFTLIGVMPENFRGLDLDTDIWIPSTMITTQVGLQQVDERGNRWLGALGRLRDGVSLEQAQSDMDAVAAQLTRDYPENNTDRGVQLVPLSDYFLGNTRRLLLIVMGAVAVFLLLACANAAGLQLVRASARRREMAIRLAMGAHRSRLILQLLIEGLVLALMGAAAGLLIAQAAIATLVPLLPEGILPAYVDVTLNGRALAFSMSVALLCGVVFGLIPAFRSPGMELADTLREGGRTSTSGIIGLRRPGAQQLLVVTEVALALVLLIGAGLLLRSFQRLLAVDPGFRPERVVSAQFSLPAGERYNAEGRGAFALQLADRIRQLPGVEAVAVGSDLPLSNNWNAALLAVGEIPQRSFRFYRHQIAPGYLQALGIPLVRGREFTTTDRRDAPQVAMINQAMAERFWPGRDPIGKSFHLGNHEGPLVEIVGVAGNVRYRDLTTDLNAPEVEPDVYFPILQRSNRDLEIAVRSSANDEAIAETLRRELAAMDPAIPLHRVRTMESLLGRLSAGSRFASLILTTFGLVALVLAAVGIYGIMAFAVSRSTREIAVRMALGAAAGKVISHIVRQGFVLVVIGICLGLAGAMASTRLLSALLFEVESMDVMTFAAISAALAAVALLASWLPARRAARIAPQTALRAD